MTGQLKAVDGIIGAPGYTFAADTTTGIWRNTSAGTQMVLAVSGTNIETLGTTQVTVTPNWTGSGTVTSTGAFTASSTSTFTGLATFNGGTTLSSGTTVTFNSTSYVFGAGAPAAFWSAIASPVSIEILISGGGGVISTGNKGQLHIPFPMTVNSWTTIAEQSGSIVVDILRANNAVPSSSIVGAGNKPTLSSQQIASANVSGWTSTALATNDFLDFNVTSATTVQVVTVVLKCTRTG